MATPEKPKISALQHQVNLETLALNIVAKMKQKRKKATAPLNQKNNSIQP